MKKYLFLTDYQTGLIVKTEILEAENEKLTNEITNLKSTQHTHNTLHKLFIKRERERERKKR